jgi:NAD+ synthase
MQPSLLIAIAQINPVVGDLEGNCAKIMKLYKQAQLKKVDLIIFPELALHGYSAEDLLLSTYYQQEAELFLQKLAKQTEDSELAMLVGSLFIADNKLYNSAFLLDKGNITGRAKHHLPNYDTFDERRVFKAGPLPQPIEFRGLKLGVLVCEDLWHQDVADHLKSQGANLFISMNASPFTKEKHSIRIKLATECAKKHQLSLLYVNMVGGQDSLIFDGGSFICNSQGQIVTQMPFFEESMLVKAWPPNLTATAQDDQLLSSSPQSLLYNALVLGLRDYIQKNNFKSVILGLSGGVDSALTATIAVDAIGASNVKCVMLPSIFTSTSSITDAKECAELLGVELESISISEVVDNINHTLAPLFSNLKADITEENIQARTRGLLLMAISNKFGHLLLTTGNKSEIAVGYATLYGDMCGGFNPIKDIYKSEVFELCRWRNGNYIENLLGKKGICIPERVITKAPTAELKPNQTDQDSLPPYELLDQILYQFIEENKSTTEIITQGFDEQIVRQISKLILRSEHKRKQSAPGTKVSKKAFGIDRRYPITNKWYN